MPRIGYAAAAELSKRSVTEGILIRDLVTREGILPSAELDMILDLRRMTEIGVPTAPPSNPPTAFSTPELVRATPEP
jgi:fumarate hydratase class II/aspartate ammonia-lyase